jgi:hypothetical protein
MDVTDFLPDIFRRPEISVIASTSLPESVVTLSIRLPIFHLPDEVHSVGTHPKDSSFGHRYFHGYQNPANPNTHMGEHYYVYVFRHEDIGQKIVKTASSTSFERLCEPLTTSRT